MLENSKLIQAYRGVKQATPPIWFMRQAGRYLPEYRELRKKHRMLDLIQSPKLAAEVTLQPLRRFDLDGSIIFADILNPLMAMGAKLDFVDGEGPKIFNPVRTRSDISNLIVPKDAGHVDYTLEAISIVASELAKKNIPLLGFCGAPFTLSSYLIEGGSSSSLSKVKALMFSDFEAWNELQLKLVQMLTDYLIAQVKAGAAALQIFDSWLGHVSPWHYSKYVEPYLVKLISDVKKQVTVPVVFFATGISQIYSELKNLPCDIMGVDFRITLLEANRLLDGKFPLQGNLDPSALFASKEHLKQEVDLILKQGKDLKSHIFNLGHGILPETPIENVEYVIQLIKQ